MPQTTTTVRVAVTRDAAELLRGLIRSRLFTDEESAALVAAQG